MSNIALGQAASVEKLICTDLNVSGIITTPNSFTYGTATAPVNMAGITPTIVVGNVNKVSLYVYNLALNQISFIMTLPSSGIRNHSFTVTSALINVIGGATTDDVVTLYSLSPYLSATGNQVLVSVLYSVALLVSLANAQRITVLITADS